MAELLAMMLENTVLAENACSKANSTIESLIGAGADEAVVMVLTARCAKLHSGAKRP